MPNTLAQETPFEMEKPKGVQSFFSKIVLGVVFTLLLFPVLTGADAFLADRNFPFFPKSSPPLVLLMMLFMPILLFSLFKDRGSQLWQAYRNTLRVIVPLWLVALISLIWGMHPSAYWYQGFRSIVMDMYHWLLMVLCIGIASSATVRKHHRKILFIIFLSACGGIWYSVENPLEFTENAGRASGFIGNANEGALSIILLSIACTNWKKHDWINLIVWTIAAMAVIPTLSVGNLILFLIVLTIYVVISLKRESALKKIGFSISVVVLLFFVIFPLSRHMVESNAMFADQATQARIQTIFEFTKGDMSFATDHERKHLVLEYLELVEKAPLLGHGTNFSRTRFYPAHNMYLKHWVENGILGLIFYLIFLAVSFSHFYRLKDMRGMIFIFSIALAGVHDHNLLQNRNVVGLLGILGALAYYESLKSRKPKKPAPIPKEVW